MQTNFQVQRVALVDASTTTYCPFLLRVLLHGKNCNEPVQRVCGGSSYQVVIYQCRNLSSLRCDIDPPRCFVPGMVYLVHRIRYVYDIILEINDTRGKLEVLALHTTARELFTAVVWQASFCDDGVLVSPRKVSIIIIIICNFLIYLCIPITSDVWWSGTKCRVFSEE